MTVCAIGSIRSASFLIIETIYIQKACLITYRDAGPSTFQCQVFHITCILIHIVATTNHFYGSEGGGGGGGGKELAGNPLLDVLQMLWVTNSCSK